MFRKIDRTEKCCYVGAPSSWKEVQRVVDGSKVRFDVVSSDTISSQQLDPNVVTLERMLEKGVTLDPRILGQYFNSTDPADIEKYVEDKSSKLYEYVKTHEDAIRKELNPDLVVESK